MKKCFVLLACIFLFTLKNYAQPSFLNLPGGEVALKASLFEIGVRKDGSYGASTLPIVSSYHNNVGTSLGFIGNPGKNNWLTIAGDYFVPGTPEEGWGIEFDGHVNINDFSNGFGPYILDTIPGSNTVAASFCNSLNTIWNGAIKGMSIKQLTNVNDSDLFFTVTVQLTNTTTATMHNVYYCRNLDPDNDVIICNSYQTTNTILSTSRVSAVGYGPGCPGNYIEMVTTDPRARASVGSFFTDPPSDIWFGNLGHVSTVGYTNNADEAISLAFFIDSLIPSQTTVLTFRYQIVPTNLLSSGGFSYGTGNSIFCYATPCPLPTLSSSFIPGGTFSFATPQPPATINASTGVISNWQANTVYYVNYTSNTIPCYFSSTVVNVVNGGVSPFDIPDFCVNSTSPLPVQSSLFVPGGSYSILSSFPKPITIETINPSTGLLSNVVSGQVYTIKYATPPPCAMVGIDEVAVFPPVNIDVTSTNGCENNVISISATSSFPLTDFSDTSNSKIVMKDIDTVTSILNVSKGFGSVSNNVSIEVEFTITHPNVSDLTVKLAAPNGTELTLYSQSGFGANFYQTKVTSSATTSFLLGFAPYTNTFLPDIGGFNKFLGSSINGNWKLIVMDDFFSSIGSIDNWSIKFSRNTSFVHSIANNGVGTITNTTVSGGNNQTVDYTISNLPIGVQTLDLTSGLATGCNTVKSTPVKIFDTPELDSINVQCSNGNNGKITVFLQPINNGNPPLTGTDAGVWEFKLSTSSVWQTSPTFTGLSTGNYIVDIRNSANPNCLTSTALINVPTAHLNPINLGLDIYTCLGNPPLNIQLTAATGYSYYQWQDNSNTNIRTVNNYGKYSIIAIDDFGCKSLDTIEIVKLCLPDLDIPNAFSPNADGYNDYFKFFLKNATLKTFSIYNRWGEKIFFSTNINDSWDGTFKGTPEPFGTYTYLIEYIEDESKREITKKGNITLIR